jgi:hypothetical protein
MTFASRAIVTPDLIRGLPAFAPQQQGGSRLKAGMTVEVYA